MYLIIRTSNNSKILLKVDSYNVKQEYIWNNYTFKNCYFIAMHTIEPYVFAKIYNDLHYFSYAQFYDYKEVKNEIEIIGEGTFVNQIRCIIEYTEDALSSFTFKDNCIDNIEFLQLNDEDEADAKLYFEIT